jgi:hypothetical protein
MKNLIISDTLRDELVSQLEFLSHFICGGGQETIEELQGKLQELEEA